MTRRAFISGVAVTGTSLWVASCTPGPSGSNSPTSPAAGTATPTPTGPPKAITVVTGGRNLLFAPLYLAMSADLDSPGKSFFQASGAEPTLTEVAGGAVAVAAVLGGTALASTTSGAAHMNAIKQGAPLRIVAIQTSKYVADMTMRNSFLQGKSITPQSAAAQKIEALRGARVGIFVANDSIQQLVEFLFRTYTRLDPAQSVSFLPLGTDANIYAAFQQGNIDVMCPTPPNGQLAEAAGIGRVMLRGQEVPELSNFPFSVYGASVDAITNKRPELVATLKSILRGIRLVQREPDRAKGVLKAQYFPSVPQEQFDVSFGNIRLVLPTTIVPSQQDYDQFKKFNEVVGNPFSQSFAQVMDPGPAEEATRQLGQ